jgi:hypothetical protein
VSPPANSACTMRRAVLPESLVSRGLGATRAFIDACWVIDRRVPGAADLPNWLAALPGSVGLAHAHEPMVNGLTSG